MGNPDSSLLHQIIQVALAFAVVFALLGLFGMGLRYVSARGIKMPGLSARSKRMTVVETLVLDTRRRLMIVRCDQREHVLLLGPNQDVVVGSSTTVDERPAA